MPTDVWTQQDQQNMMQAQMRGNPYAQPGFGRGGYPQMQQQFGQYQPQQQMQGADQGNARIDKLKGRVSNLQEQMKGAGTQDMAGIQARMDQMQGRIKGLRKDRRQGEGQYDPQAGQGGAQPEPAMFGGPQMGNQMGGMAQYFGQRPMGYGGMQQGFGMNPMQGGGMYGGGMYGMGEGAFRGGGMGGGNVSEYNTSMGPPDVWGGGGGGAKYGGGYNPNQYQSMIGQQPQGANRPGMQYRQDRRQARQGEAAPGPNPGGAGGGFDPGGGGNMGPDQSALARNLPLYSASSYDTPFGRLVTSSTGNNNVFQKNGGSGEDLYHYDPTQGWKHMTAQEYKGYGDYNYADPTKYAKQAGALNVNPFAAAGGPWKGPSGGLKPNTSGIGSYG